MIRPKVLFTVLLAGAVCLGVAAFVSHYFGQTIPVLPREGVGKAIRETSAAGAADTTGRRPLKEPASSQRRASSREQSRHSNLNPAGSADATPGPTNSIPGAGKMTEEEVERVIQAKQERLQDLSRKSDHASMEAILAEIKSPYPEVRQDAIEAIVQFRSRDAIPELKKIAAQTKEPREKVAILDAIQFLELPTLQEFRAHLEKARQQSQANQASPQ